MYFQSLAISCASNLATLPREGPLAGEIFPSGNNAFLSGIIEEEWE
jgi:hypothetical protein